METKTPTDGDIPHNPWFDEPPPVSTLYSCVLRSFTDTHPIATGAWPYRSHPWDDSKIMFHEFRGYGPPPSNIGYISDIYLDLTPSPGPRFLLYTRTLDEWVCCNWSEDPTCSIFPLRPHPLLRNRHLCANVSHGFTWLTKRTLRRKEGYSNLDEVDFDVLIWEALSVGSDIRQFAVEISGESLERKDAEATRRMSIWRAWTKAHGLHPSPSPDNHKAKALSKKAAQKRIQHRRERGSRYHGQTDDAILSDGDNLLELLQASKTEESNANISGATNCSSEETHSASKRRGSASSSNGHKRQKCDHPEAGEDSPDSEGDNVGDDWCLSSSDDSVHERSSPIKMEDEVTNDTLDGRLEEEENQSIRCTSLESNLVRTELVQHLDSDSDVEDDTDQTTESSATTNTTPDEDEKEPDELKSHLNQLYTLIKKERHGTRRRESEVQSELLAANWRTSQIEEELLEARKQLQDEREENKKHTGNLNTMLQEAEKTRELLARCVAHSAAAAAEAEHKHTKELKDVRAERDQALSNAARWESRYEGMKKKIEAIVGGL